MHVKLLWKFKPPLFIKEVKKKILRRKECLILKLNQLMEYYIRKVHNGKNIQEILFRCPKAKFGLLH